MKILITESQLKTTIIKKFLNKMYPNLIISIDINDNMVDLTLKGESDIKKESELIKNIKNDLKIFFSDDYKINISTELKYSIEVTFTKAEKKRYDFQLQKELENGEIFEMDGQLIPYHSGRDTEYELEPGYISNEEYYSDHWEDIEEVVIDKFYQLKDK